MTEPADIVPVSPNLPVPADDGLVAWMHVIYGLHGLAVLIGATSAATIVGAFVFGVPSIIAVILAYVKRDDARGTWLESHYRWSLRTFWLAIGWGIGAALATFLLFITIIGILIAWLPLLALGIWVAYRVIRGWLALKDRRPLPMPQTAST